MLIKLKILFFNLLKEVIVQMSNMCQLGEILEHEIHSDQLNPVTMYATVGGNGACIFESAYDDGYGIHSFIGLNPLGTLSAIGQDVTIDIQGQIKHYNDDPYVLLEQFAHGRKAFGFIGYDAIRLKEAIPTNHTPQPTPDFFFHVYKTIIKFDHKVNKIIIYHEGSPQELEQLVQKIYTPITLRHFPPAINKSPKVNVSDNEYQGLVKRAQEYIKQGDIFQVVLSRTFTMTNKATPLDLYRALRQTNSTPYLAFFQEKEYSIASASPELLVGIKDGVIETVPIAGTCRSDEDIEVLLADPKENAEHTMLVDLARNDIGTVALPGSVKVTQYKVVRNYTNVRHVVSRVVGTLDQKRFKPLDVVKFMLPAGTLSGAPKIRAMEIIEELEYSSRGLYGGTILMLHENGDITGSIAIRTMVIYKNKVEVRAGAGIVLDSVPTKESIETQLKSSGVISAVNLANSGL